MAKMNYHVTHEELYSIIEINGSLSNDSLLEIKQVMKDTIKRSKNGIIIDLSSVDFICSAALGIFFSVNVEASELGKKMLLCNLEEEIQKLMLITGVNRHLKIRPSIETAIKEIIHGQ